MGGSGDIFSSDLVSEVYKMPSNALTLILRNDGEVAVGEIGETCFPTNSLLKLNCRPLLKQVLTKTSQPIFDSRIVRRTVCESMPSRVQKLLQWVVALENQHAIRAVCKGTPTRT